MKAYFFKFPGSDWVGLAVGQDDVEIFWQIDEHGDPYSVKVMPTTRGSVCIRFDGVDSDDPDEYPTEAETESSDNFPVFEDGRKWRAPKWPKTVYGAKGKAGK